MNKLISVVLIAMCLLLVLSGCNDLGIIDALTLDEDLHITFETFEDTDDIKYQNTIYYLSPISFLDEDIITTDNYEYLGWTGSRFFYNSDIYANSKEKPVFLYTTNTRETYFRKDYDYKNDNFIINETNNAICFADDLSYIGTNFEMFNSNPQYVNLTSACYPTLTIRLEVIETEDSWYVRTKNCIMFEMSDNFIAIFKTV